MAFSMARMEASTLACDSLNDYSAMPPMPMALAIAEVIN
jgi:hypothetical protein